MARGSGFMRQVVGMLAACLALLLPSALARKKSSALSPIAVVEDKWDFLGPFANGKAELGADFLRSQGGIHRIARADTSKYPSEFAQGGRLGWQRLKSQGNEGQVSVNYNLGGRSFYAWAVGDLTIQEAGCVELKAEGSIKKAYVRLGADEMSGQGTEGDQGLSPEYSKLRRIPTAPNSLVLSVDPGSYTLYVQISGGQGGSEFRVKALTCQEPKGELKLFKLLPGDWQWGHGRWPEGPPAYDLPDLVGGRVFSDFIHLRIANTGGTWLRELALKVIGSELIVASQSPHLMTLAPGQRSVVYSQLELHPNVTEVSGKDCPLKVSIQVTGYGGVSENTSLLLRCRGAQEGFLFTFLDADGSPQSAGARLPKNPCKGEGKGEGCPILMSTHGMDVTGQRQADAYKTKPSMWILAPHGRATHGFNWQGPGHWSADAAIEALVDLSSRFLEGKHQASSKSMIFTGHSNGGFGAIFFSALNPDRAWGVAPLAGMPTLGDDGRGQFAAHGAEPELAGLLEGTVSEYRGDLLMGNLKGVPFFARTGAQDEVANREPRSLNIRNPILK